MTGLGLYVALLEPFIVKSMRRVMSQNRDENLEEEVERFCRQEAQHYQQHERFNAVALAYGYPGLAERIQVLREDFAPFLDVCRITMRNRLEQFIARMVPRVRSMLPSYTPHHYEIPRRVAALSARFSAMAESTA